MKSNRNRFQSFTFGALVGMVALLCAPMYIAPGCSAEQVRAETPAAEAAFAGLCADESMIPYGIGAFAAATCPGQEAAFAKEMAKLGAPTPGPAKVAVFTKSPSGALVHCGTLAPVGVPVGVPLAGDGGAPRTDGGR